MFGLVRKGRIRTMGRMDRMDRMRIEGSAQYEYDLMGREVKQLYPSGAASVQLSKTACRSAGRTLSDV